MIYETVIVSTNQSGEAHVAPFGIRREGELVVIAPYKPSKTLDNILATKAATMNMTDDVRVFAAALTRRTAWQLLPVDLVKGYRLQDCLTHVELTLKEVKEDTERPQLLMQPIATVNHRGFDGFNRAQAAVIELAVLTSRLHMLPAEKIRTEREYLQIAIDKTAGERELEAWDWLTKKIDDYYKEKQI